MINNPEISVVLPTYNRADILFRAIRSVLSQSFRNFELIIVDDGSTDETEELVKKIADTRIRYIKNINNKGGSEARNIGVKESRAHIVAFQDSDDEWLPGKLERSVAVLKSNNDYECVFTAFWQIQDRRARYMPLAVPPINAGCMHEHLLWRNFIDTPTVVMYKETFQRCGGFDPNMPRFQDWELFMRVARDSSICFIPEPLILSYATAGSISTNELAEEEALLKMYKKYGAEIEMNSDLNSVWMARIGNSQMANGNYKEGRKKLFNAFLKNPRNIRAAVALLYALPGNVNLYKKLVNLTKRTVMRDGW